MTIMPDLGDTIRSAAEDEYKRKQAEAAAAKDGSQKATQTKPKFTYNYPIKFNPGIHKSLLHEGYLPGVTRTPFKGTIVSYGTQYDNTFDQGWRFGFRLHFNPTQITVSTSLDTTIDPDPMEAWKGLHVSANQQVYSIDLKLRRVADVAETDLSAFLPALVPSELTDIKRRGTIVDLEYIFRAMNGQQTSVDGNYYTSDIGYMLYNLLNFNLSRTWKFTGFISNMVVQHNMFTPDMVPIDTDVHLDVTRMSTTPFLNYIPALGGAVPLPRAPGGNQNKRAI